MNHSSNMNESEFEGEGINQSKLIENGEKNKNRAPNEFLERIYDGGQGEKFNDLIKNPTKIKAMKAFITEDDIDNMLNLPPDKTKIGFSDIGANGTMNHVSGNMQDLLSITGFKIIDKLPPTSGDIKNNTNSLIDRFRVSANDFVKTGNNTTMNMTRSKWSNNGTLEPKLSRPTTTIINLGQKYSAKIENEKNEAEKRMEEKLREQEALEREKLLKENPLEELNKEIDESDQDDYMNKIHKFIRDAFENRDHKMDFVYYLPSTKENYYDLIPKDFNAVANEPTYYTLSPKGLTVYIDKKPKEFIKLAEWINERQRYNVIAEIPFFKNFKIWRIITMWRKNIFKQKKIAYQDELNDALLFNNENYNVRLIEHKKLCNEILFLKIVDMKVGLESNSFQKFQDMQKDLRKKNKKKLDDIHFKCQTNFETSLRTIFKKVQEKINELHNKENHNIEEKKGGIKGKDKKKEKVEEKIEEKIEKNSTTDQKTNPNDDEIVGFDNFSYKNKMLIKDECKNFVKLAYLFDYIMLDLLRRMFINSMTDVFTKLDEYNSFPIPEKKENILNKNGEFIKPQVLNPNRVVPYFMIQCKLDDKPIERVDYIYKKVKPFYVKATPDAEFDPTAHIQIDKEEMDYQRQLKEGKTQKEIIIDNNLALLASENIEIKEIKRPHHYFITYSPDCDELKNRFEKEINETLGELKVKGWRAHPKFSSYLKYMDDWDEKYGEWDTDVERDLNVEEILKEDAHFVQKDQEITAKIKEAYKKCDTYLERLDPYLQVQWKQKSIDKKILLDEYLKDSDEIFRLIFVYSDEAKKVIEKYIPYDEEIGMIKLNLEDGLRKELCAAQNSIINFLKENYPDKLKKRREEIEKWCDEMQNKISGEIGPYYSKFLEKSKAKDSLEIWYDINERKLNSMFIIVNQLKNKGFEKITAEDVKMFDSLKTKKFILKTTWDNLNEKLSRSQETLLLNLNKKDIPNLLNETIELDKPLNEAKFVNYISAEEEERKKEIVDNIDELTKYDKDFQYKEQQSEIYNNFLREVGQPEYNFNTIENFRNKLNILRSLWDAISKFSLDCQSWKQKNFSELNTTEVLNKCGEYEITAQRARGEFGDKGSAIETLLKDVQNFAEIMKVVDYLKCEDLDLQHFDRLQGLFPGDLPLRFITKDYTIESLLFYKIYEKEKLIREIQLEAINNKKLEEEINNILGLKKDIQMSVNLDKKMIDNYSELLAQCEEGQSQINSVVASRYAKNFKQRGDKNPFKIKADFEAYLNAIDFLKLFQKKYKYLENIINSGDMKRKLGDSNFDKVDIEWKTALNKSVSGNISKILDLKQRMSTFGKVLDQIQQKIEEQLKVMRNSFERFYFISNDDLLFMLANSKSSGDKNANTEGKKEKDGIEMLKPYLSKIFEDIYDLKFSTQNQSSMNKEINGIVSLVKEELMFQKNFSERKVKIDDDLERWLSNLESTINETLKEKMILAYKVYVDIKDVESHKNWLKKIVVANETNEQGVKKPEKQTTNISQVIATISHVYFCENTENAIKELSKEQNSLMDWYSKIDQAILSYSRIVNEKFANDDKNIRRIISNLITHHVHYKDIMKELIEVEPAIEDFEWQKQLRAYILSSEPGGRDERNLTVIIKQLKYEYEYGYEYFGPTTRIVISPLTDRVWLTMSSALQIKLGCSLGGPAGTGKTETTKDLAKFFGIQCIVFNCSEQIDYKILGNIFSGLCKHKYGAYACLDEFNRINLEVLSVIATQLFKIRQAQLAEEKSVTIMTDAIDLVGKSGVFITMNPTYSGRSELPDNLKANFRPITMMRPEFSKIAQVKLYSEGFSESDVLSKKLYKLYDLAQQQLSQQDHYDFTLRTLGTVLSMAGNLKRKTKSEIGHEKKDEDKIILSSLKDANFPKFIAEDIKLFQALLSDLFPDIEMEEVKSEFFEEQMKIVINELKMDASAFTIEKSRQLIDIMNIRLGICLTGPPGTGKSAVIKLVSKVSTKIRDDFIKLEEQIKKEEKEKEDAKLEEEIDKPKKYEQHENEKKKEEEEVKKPTCDPKYKLVKSWIINPKSITMGELFGEENEEKKIFEYGIATKKIKKALIKEGDDRFNIVILDGPIDTKWIENMNSVLDDTQTLCLANGERIKLKSHVKVFFEVEDLSKASLATVSRLGVIYFGPKELGWRPYAHYWMNTFFTDESVLPNELQNYVNQLFEDKVDEAIDTMDDLYVSGCCFMKPSISSMIQSLCHLLEFYITKEHGFIGREMKGLDNQDQIGRYKKKIIMCFSLAMVWGMFGSVNNKGCPRVESFIRNKFNEIKLENSQVIMEHFYSFEKDEFQKFATENPPFKYVPHMQFNSIYVPTIDSLRYSFVLDILLKARKHVYVTGETGTGKTAIIQNIIKSYQPSSPEEDSEWTFIRMNFSAQTSSFEIQEGLEKKLEQKKGKKLLWGQGGKNCLIYIDDINMPEPNEWGAHPPIEFLRQYLDQGGWYDRPQFFWKNITGTNMVVSGGPAVGGRSQLTGRFTRHFTILCFPQPNKQVLGFIFENILRGFFTTTPPFSDAVKKHLGDTITATIELYEFMLSNMKPIPSKFHYIFNLRDVSRVFQGILMIDSKYFQTSEVYIKLWLHEVERVFCDRLVNPQDLKEVRENICYLMKNKFKAPWSYDQLFNKGPPIYYGEIHKGMFFDRPYEFIEDHTTLGKRLDEYVNIYNSKNKTAPMNVVFFDYFISHILRVARVLRQPRGSMVLIGHGGSGKQTVCQLAAFTITQISDHFTTFSAPRDFRVDDFKKKMKEIIRRSNYYSLVLLLNDNNVGHNFILENINNFLSNGEIPGLLELSYLDQVEQYPVDPDLTYEKFVEKSRNNMHILFCTSPVGENLRQRMRKFPSLINCCVLDWFMPWPQSALISCCKKAFGAIPYEEEIKDRLVKLVCEAHLSIENLRDDFFDELGRKVYITPKSFLDMNAMLINLMKVKKDENDSKIRVLDDGTKKIKKTQQDIVKLEEDIRKLEPQILEKEKYLGEYVEKIKVKREEVQEQHLKVKYIKDQVEAKAKEVKSILSDIKGKSDKCQTAFNKIKQKVKEKLGSDTLALFSKEKPTNELKIIVPEALAYFLNGKHTKSEEKSYAYQVFEKKHKIYTIEELLEKNEISDSVFEEFKKYLYEKVEKVFEKYKPELETVEEKLGKLSETHQTLYIWGKGVIDLWEINKQLKPLKEDHKNRKEELDKLDAQYKALSIEQKEKEESLNNLETEKKKAKDIIDSLQNQKNTNTIRKNNASKLIRLLRGENERWTEQLAQLRKDEKNFLGNIILSSLFISYLSPFSGRYRKNEVNFLLELCDKYKINVAKDFSLEKVMSDQVEIRQWTMSGLPNDTVSIENAIMFTNNKKFPLFIDPQLQGNQWLKKMNKDKMNIYKADCKEENLKAQFEAITLDIIAGRTTLLENCGEIIDSVYSPIINQAVFTEESTGLEKIKFNGNDREYNRDFKMYFTTKISNPHYPPEFFIKLNIINFTVTQSGLSEQLLSEVFKCERREKYEKRDEIIASMGQMNDQLASFSRDILKQLSETPEDQILDAEDLIQNLEDEKVISDDVNEKMKNNMIIEEETTRLRNEYVPVSVRGSILYFTVSSLSKIDPMYQFSLEYFIKIFVNSIMFKQDVEEQSTAERVNFLVKKVTEDIYKNIKRGLFESHKALFSFLIDINIRKEKKEISEEEFSFFVKGPSSFDTSEKLENPNNKFFSEFQWNSVLYLEEKFKFNGLSVETKEKLPQIEESLKKIENLKESFDDNLKPLLKNVGNSQKLFEKNFLKLIFLKIYKPEKLLFYIKDFIKDDLGELFIDTTPSRLEEVYQESDWRTPIIFILSKGADPTNEFLSFKERYEKIRKEKFLEEEEEKKRLEEEERQRELEREAEEKEEEEKEKGENGEEREEREEKEHREEKEEVAEKKSEKSVNNEENNTEKDNKEEGGEAKEAGDGEEEKAEGSQKPEEEEKQNAYEFKTYIISLGQGQEEEAKKAILEYGIKNGAWVLLQNCHLFTSFMPDLATIVQSLQQEYTDTLVEVQKEKAEIPNKEKGKPVKHQEEKGHKQAEKEKDPRDFLCNTNFRLWLTSMPVKTFPVSILQNSLKLTTEPPSGIKSNMKKLFNDITEEDVKPIIKQDKGEKREGDERTPEEIAQEKIQMEKDNQTKKEHFTKILYSLSLFHAVLQERKKFGPIGFNLRYDFNQGDFNTSSQLVNIYLSEADVDFIPWDSILYLIGEVTYGGCIVDETDRIVMNSTLTKFINENLFSKKDEHGNDLPEEAIINFGNYSIPAYKTLVEYQKYISNLPGFDDPIIFGLNDNANIVYELKESGNFLNNLTYVLPKELNKKSGGKTSNDIVLDQISNIFSQNFELIDKKARNKIHDKVYDNDLKHPLTIVLIQEIDRYNNLLKKLDSSLKELKGAIEGTTIMSNESDEIYNSLLVNKIPQAWSKIGYSSFKPFGSWLTDLKKRIEFIMDWLVNGHPNAFWISGLFYPQGFITGIYQNHARETKIAVSDITLKFTVMNQYKNKDDVEKAPSAGIYVYGLYLEGASWDEKNGLVEQKPGEMRFYMPIIWFETIKDEKVIKDEDDEGEEEEIFFYSCPMFKTGKRASVIASSGHSEEKIINVELHSKLNSDYWTLNGTALLTQLDE